MYLSSSWRVPAAGTARPGRSPKSGSPPISLRRALVALAGFAAGAVPVSNIAARRTAGVDLRSVGSGTVSGTSLAAVAGGRALVVAGCFELLKGAAGPIMAGRDDGVGAALAGAAAVAGHNWSPWLGWAGGRGISPAMGALAVSAPAGAGALAAGLAVGRLSGETALGCLGAYALLVPVARRVHGRRGALAAGAVLVPVLLKRLLGNEPPPPPLGRTLFYRFVFDRDTLAKPPAPARRPQGGGGHVPVPTAGGQS